MLCAVVQGFSLLFSASCAHGTLGASSKLFLQILGAQIYEGALVGRNSLQRAGDFTLFTVCFLGTVILAYCFVPADLEWRLFFLFCAAIFAGSLWNPNAGKSSSQWAALAGVWDTRYQFFPMLGFIWSVVWCAAYAKPRTLRLLPSALLVLALIYGPKNWIIPPLPDVHFMPAARVFERAQSGTVAFLPVLPQGWTMQLTHK